MEILKHLELWQRIAAFPLNHPNSAHPFLKKLMTEQTWSENKALRTIAEYKKFIYLAIVEPNGASPSKAVDEVWHLHITYTEGYAQFCETTAGRFLHHHPSKGGEAEYLRHKTWASDTLENYEKHFGYAPPSDIWDIPWRFQFESQKPIEFDSVAFFEPSSEVLAGGGFVLGVLCLSINPYILGSNFLIFYVLMAIIGLAMATVYESEKLKTAMPSIESDFPTDLNHLQVATFLHDASYAVKLLLVDLMESEVLKKTTPVYVQHFELHRLSANTETERLYQNPLYTTLACVEKPILDAAFLQDITQPIASTLNRQLYNLKKLTATTFYLKWAVRILVFIGAIRLFQGLFVHHSVGFLVFILILIGLFSWFTESTILGDFKDKVHAWVSREYRQILPQVTVAEQFAFEPPASLDTAFVPMLLLWDTTLASSNASQNDASGGGDGGGGGCGGGCGGCGG